MFKTDIIEKEARTMLVNTMYFKGIWLDNFNEDRTHPREFYVSRRDSVFVSTLNKDAKFNTGAISEWQASFVEIPYKVNVELSIKKEKVVRP